MISGDSIRIRASFYRLFKFSFQVLLFAVFAGLVAGAIKSTGDSGLDREAALEIIFYIAIGSVPAALILAIFLFGVTSLATVTVSSDVISGRTFGGFKAKFPSSSVTEVKAWRNQGVSYLRVVSDKSHRDITIVLLGVSIRDYATRLPYVLGTEHLLSKWFADNAA